MTFSILLLPGKEFLGQNIKVELAEKRVPKGGFGRGRGMTWWQSQKGRHKKIPLLFFFLHIFQSKDCSFLLLLDNATSIY